VKKIVEKCLNVYRICVCVCVCVKLIFYKTLFNFERVSKNLRKREKRKNVFYNMFNLHKIFKEFDQLLTKNTFIVFF